MLSDYKTVCVEQPFEKDPGHVSETGEYRGIRREFVVFGISNRGSAVSSIEGIVSSYKNHLQGSQALTPCIWYQGCCVERMGGRRWKEVLAFDMFRLGGWSHCRQERGDNAMMHNPIIYIGSTKMLRQ